MNRSLASGCGMVEGKAMNGLANKWSENAQHKPLHGLSSLPKQLPRYLLVHVWVEAERLALEGPFDVVQAARGRHAQHLVRIPCEAAGRPGSVAWAWNVDPVAFSKVEESDGDWRHGLIVFMLRQHLAHCQPLQKVNAVWRKRSEAPRAGAGPRRTRPKHHEYFFQ